MSEIMVKSFRFAFSDFISKQTIDVCTVELRYTVEVRYTKNI
ncbi:hypothetical protein [Ruminococcus sp.]|nr:hypothetical protein [Ruminococcus sp.]MDD6988804.1 hypothetical protein [Ruminococcus sp.]MDY6200846.1 hypothetical protein [Ruminococcus sp.]